MRFHKSLLPVVLMAGTGVLASGGVAMADELIAPPPFDPATAGLTVATPLHGGTEPAAIIQTDAELNLGFDSSTFNQIEPAAGLAVEDLIRTDNPALGELNLGISRTLPPLMQTDGTAIQAEISATEVSAVAETSPSVVPNTADISGTTVSDTSVSPTAMVSAEVSSSLNTTPNSAHLTPGERPATHTLAELLNMGLQHSDELKILDTRIRQAEASIEETRAAYYPQLNANFRFGRDAAYPSSARTKTDPRGQSEFVNASSARLELNQMLFDGFKTDSDIDRQLKELDSLKHRRQMVRNQLITDTLEVYLTSWRHIQSLEAGVALVESLQGLKQRIDLQVEGGAADNTLQSYASARLGGATQELVKTLNAFRETIFRLGYLTETELAPDQFVFGTVRVPSLQALDAYVADVRQNNPEILEETAKLEAASHDLRRSKSSYYPSVSLTGEIQDANDLGGSTGNVRTGNAMVQMNYKLFDGFAASSSRARIREQIAEAELRIRRTTRRLEEDMAQSWRKAHAMQQEVGLAIEQADANLNVRNLRKADMESGQGDTIRLIEAEEALYTSRLKQLDLVQQFAMKRFDLAIQSGQLDRLECLNESCLDLPLEDLTELKLDDSVALPPLSADDVSATQAAPLPNVSETDVSGTIPAAE